ncbi:hypothetical protein [Luteimonas abyssi]|uniref:hypothetical protein n=1 Tax=Luteimonas abyssi TaxID=1247514 RepID=UPI000737B389|nr:hypothetical protein [Luteimonas abyssi]
MSWLGLLVLAVGLYLAFKLVGVVLKLLVFVVALVLGYALIAPQMGWPGPMEIAYVMGPDVQGLGPDGFVLPDAAAMRDRVVQDVTGAVSERVVQNVGDAVAERFGSSNDAAAHAAEALPCPEPEPRESEAVDSARAAADPCG